MPNRKKQSTRASAKTAPGIEVRRSGVHGRGVYAVRSIPKGTRIIEYTGKRVSWEATARDSGHSHTFIFGLGSGTDVIDAGIGGNEARWINHSCDPNCEAIEKNGRVFIHAMRDIQPGEELSYDYGLEIDEPRTKKIEKTYECRCRAPNCRGTMLGPVDD